MWDVGPKEAPSIELGHPRRGAADGPRLASSIQTGAGSCLRGRAGPEGGVGWQRLMQGLWTRTGHDDALDSLLLRNGG